ncbi:MAG: hypothetical protein ACI9VM_000356 [Candidatus Azotimanducaceae bacterium]|jgi:hypothetical protein
MCTPTNIRVITVLSLLGVLSGCVDPNKRPTPTPTPTAVQEVSPKGKHGLLAPLLTNPNLVSVIKSQATIQGKDGSSALIQQWTEAPASTHTVCDNPENCTDNRNQFVKFVIMPVRENAAVTALARGQLPSQYGQYISDNMDSGDFDRATCDEVVLVATHMGEYPMPLGPHVVSDHTGGYRMAALMSRIKVSVGSYSAMVVPLIKHPGNHEGRAARISFPHSAFTNVPEPIFAFQIWHKGKIVKMKYAPGTVTVPNTLFTTGAEIKNAVRNNRTLVITPILSDDACLN